MGVDHDNGIISEAEKEKLEWAGTVYEGIHVSDFDVVEEFLAAAGNPDPNELISTATKYLPITTGSAGRRRLVSVLGVFGCIGGAIATGGACTVGEVYSFGLATGGCIAAGTGMTSTCGSLF